MFSVVTTKSQLFGKLSERSLSEIVRHWVNDFRIVVKQLIVVRNFIEITHIRLIRKKPLDLSQFILIL